jgi:hypothetical protein
VRRPHKQMIACVGPAEREHARWQPNVCMGFVKMFGYNDDHTQMFVWGARTCPRIDRLGRPLRVYCRPRFVRPLGVAVLWHPVHVAILVVYIYYSARSTGSSQRELIWRLAASLEQWRHRLPSGSRSGPTTPAARRRPAASSFL